MGILATTLGILALVLAPTVVGGVVFGAGCAIMGAATGITYIKSREYSDMAKQKREKANKLLEG
jgi:hypothetical protein